MATQSRTSPGRSVERFIMKITIAKDSDWDVTPHRDYEVIEVDILWEEAAGEVTYFRVIGDKGTVEYIPVKIVRQSSAREDIQSLSLIHISEPTRQAEI